MILQKLPDPCASISTGNVPFFADHLLFTETIYHKYNYPEHVTGLGIISTFSGSGKFYVNGKKESVLPGSFLIVNRESKLAISIAEADTRPAILYFHSLLPAIAAASISNSTERLLDDPFAVSSTDFCLLERLHPIYADLQYKLLQIIELGSSCASFAALKADIIVRNILETLLLQNKKAMQLSSNLLGVKRSTRIELYKRLSMTREWMHNNFTSPLTLEDMAGIALLNSQHFLRLFKQVYKITPHRYIVELRLNYAKHLLSSCKETVAGICNAVGFESVCSFSALFKQRFGIAPSVFRNNLN